MFPLKLVPFVDVTEATTPLRGTTLQADSFAKLVSTVAQMYENHVCVPERNNHGHTLIAFLKNYPHVRLYQQEEVDSTTGKLTKKYGWNTDAKSKAYAIDTLKKDLKDGRCVPRSFETYDELRTFVHGERGAMAGMKGSHYDRVMALSLANVVAQQGGIGDILVVRTRGIRSSLECPTPLRSVTLAWVRR